MFGKLPLISPHRLSRLAERLAQPLGILLSLVLLVVVLRQALAADWSMFSGSTRLSVGFWATLCAYYFLSPATEWLIYSRLWGFDWRTLPALLLKLVSNELLLDYLGDAQFLAWAQSRRVGGIAPFAAIKDITVLSAVTGNLVTIVFAGLAWPYVANGVSGVPVRAVLLSFAIVLVVSCGILLLGRRIFSHSLPTLLWIAALLAVRTVVALGLGAVLWHLLMPESSLVTLFLLATFRMIVSRLPLVPNKELLFAGLAVIAMGRAADVSVATSMIASLILLLHLAVGAFLAVTHLGRIRRG